MARSKQGGAWGFLRGKVGGMSYSILSADKSGSGKKEQIIRSLPETVKNPQTAGQTMQRMKLAPAQKFYKAFSELLSNAFQGIAYGDASRRYFMALAMSEEGPYVQKSVDRFIPAAYPFSQGSLPSVGIEPFAGGATVITLANEVAEGTTTITNAEFAELLGVSETYQLTVAVVNNVNGVFIPSYIPFDNRLQIADLPEGTLAIADGKVTLNPAALGLDMSAMVACCVVLSVQDASGAWLRSTQEMIISNELRSSLYGPDALESAIYSYQSGTTVNSVNSAWYYNLGLSQAWNGKLITVTMDLNNESLADNKKVVMGIQQIDGRIVRTVFATSTDDNGLIIFIEDNKVTTSPVATVAQFKELHQGAAEYNNIEQWQDSYAAQLNVDAGGGSGAAISLNVAHYDEAAKAWGVSEESFVAIERASEAVNAPFVAVKADGTKVYLICTSSNSWGYNSPVIKKTTGPNDNPINAFGDTPTLNNETHKLSNGDANFIPFSYTDDSDEQLSTDAMDNWAVMQTNGFTLAIFLYH